MSTKRLIVDEVTSEFDEIRKMDVGSDEHKNAVDSIAKLIDREIEIRKMEAEEAKAKLELALKEEELNNQKTEAEKANKNEMIKNGISILAITVPATVTVVGTIFSMYFEEEGKLPTTFAGRAFYNRLFKGK